MLAACPSMPPAWLLSFFPSSFPSQWVFLACSKKKKPNKNQTPSSCPSSAFPSGQDNDSFFSYCSAASWQNACERGTDFASPGLSWHNKVIVKKTLHQEADLEQNVAPVVSCATPGAVLTLASLFAIVSLWRLVVH